jgi:hypothetical protein
LKFHQELFAEGTIMNLKVNRYGLAAALAGLLLSGAAHAVPITLGGSEPDLDKLFNDPTTGWIKSGDNLNVNGPEQKTSAGWKISSSGGSFEQIIIEIAGNSGINTFGIYNLSDTTKSLEIFSGSDGATSAQTLRYMGNGDFSLDNGATTTNIGSSIFGWYLGVAGGTFYSDASRNGGYDQMVAFRGDDDRITNFYNHSDPNDWATWASNEWVLAWEDIAYNPSDKDFNDFVVMVESVNPATPVPRTDHPSAARYGPARPGRQAPPEKGC